MTIENENEIADWMKSFEALPEERRDLLQRWFAMQKLIIDNSGTTADQWFRYVEWAMHNPFDYSFVLDFPDKGEGASGTSDTVRAEDETQAARKFVGAEAKRARTADSPNVKDKAKSDRRLDKELFDRFMHDRMSKGRK